MTWRFSSVIILITLCYAFLFFHLYQIQLTKGGYYLARAESQYLAAGAIIAKRGTIYFSDKNENRLAVGATKEFPVLYAVPRMIEDAAGTVSRLSVLLPGLPPDLEKKLSKKESKYELLKRKADPEVASRIAAEKIKGIYVDSVPERFYPFGTLAAHILGFVGANASDTSESGRYGIEKFYKDVLEGTSGRIEGGSITKPRDGDDLVLTVDPNIQTEAERILSSLVKDKKAKSGAVIVEDPATGRILAMGGYPTFDPNKYGESSVKDFLNPVVQKIYEPGSVMKVITMAAGIDSGKITPQTEYIDTGSVVLNGKRIENYDFKTHGAYGRATMTNVIEHSINTGAVFAERQTGDEIFKKYLLKFGFQEKTEVDLPGELKGSLRPLFEPRAPAVNFATASFGQGIAITPIELITAMGVIANAGKMMRPYLNAALQPKSLGSTISTSTAGLVSQMMISAVDKAQVAAIKGYFIAGKTGTALVPDFKKGGYTDKVINTYVGFGPVSKPRFIVLIKLDDPEGAPVAALTVVPAFRDLAQFILNYYNIPPDRL